MNVRARSAGEVAAGRPPGLRAGALLLFAASCVPMLVMLPAGFAGFLASSGIESDAGWVQALSRSLQPVAQPLLIASALLLGAGSLRCGWSPVAAALAGGALLYLGMYVVTGPAGQTQPALFYAGLALFAASPVLTLLRPRLRACRPLLTRTAAGTVLLSALALSAVLIAAAPPLGWGRATTARHAEHMMEPATPAFPAIQVAEDAFLWSGAAQGYTSSDSWFPEISTEGAVLRISGEIRKGGVFVQLMDGQAAVVHEETVPAISPRGLEVSVPGASGVWMVTLGFEGFSGKLKVEVGAT